MMKWSFGTHRAYCITVVLSVFILTNHSLSQDIGHGDDTKPRDWPSDCREVYITSSLDGATQPAYFYASPEAQKMPLVVSLHSWSAGYDQLDSLSWLCVDNKFNYIHPHFRGPNNNPKACGSPEAIQDIDDAISFAIKHGSVDTGQIHVIGSSGGGYATLLAYMHTAYPVKSFSAWVPITNLVNWYYESVGRQTKYARDIAMVTNPKDTSGKEHTIDEFEARMRSPHFMPTPVQKRADATLLMYAGIHDGYTGSVPVTQSLKFYNKVVRNFDANNQSHTISIGEMLLLLERRNSQFRLRREINKGDIHFQRNYQDKVQMVIFEGGHEMLLQRAWSDITGESHIKQ